MKAFSLFAIFIMLTIISLGIQRIAEDYEAAHHVCGTTCQWEGK